MIYARIEGGEVAETFVLPANMTMDQLFHPGLTWVAVTTQGVTQGWTYDGTAFHPQPPPPEPTVAQATLALSAMLTARETAGIFFTPTGGTSTLFPTDDVAQGKFTAAWNAINANLWTDGRPFIAADGTPVPMSTADARNLILKALGYIQACVDNYATLHAAIAADPAADISGGWPSNS